MTTETVSNESTRFGRAVAFLGLEKKVLANGFLPTKSLLERGSIVSGMVEGLFEKGDWRGVVDLVFGEGPARTLYDGNRKTLCKKITEVIKPEEFVFDKRENDWNRKHVKLLAENGGSEEVYRFALRDELDHNVARGMLYMTKEQVGEERFKKGALTLAERTQDQDPNFAYRLLNEIGDKDSVRRLYEHLLGAFSLDNIGLLLKIALDEPLWRYTGASERIRNLTKKALKAEGRKDCEVEYNPLGKHLYHLLKTRFSPIELEPEDQEELDRLAALSINQYDFRGEGGKTVFAPLELLWAKLHWEKNPVPAYRIFLDRGYGGEEVVHCARSAFETMHPHEGYYGADREKVEIKEEHMRAFLHEIPERKLDLRRIIAEQLKDRDELRRLSEIYASKGDLKRAYDLAFESGSDGNDPTIAKLRQRLIDQAIEETSRNRLGMNFYWLRDEDNTGYELIYNRLIDEHPGAAFELSKKRKDSERMETARTRILERNDPKAAFDFFKWEKDQAGYERAVDAIAAKYGVPKEQFLHLLPAIE